jgi:hypothetical protein
MVPTSSAAPTAVPPRAVEREVVPITITSAPAIANAIRGSESIAVSPAAGPIAVIAATVAIAGPSVAAPPVILPVIEVSVAKIAVTAVTTSDPIGQIITTIFVAVATELPVTVAVTKLSV